MNQHFFTLKILSVALLAGCIVLANGCSSVTNKEIETVGLKKLTDSTGAIVTVKEKPQRIVSLGISVDDILSGLVPVERIAAFTYLADYPELSNVTEIAKQTPNRAYGNLESALSLRPDLVIVPSWQPKALVQALRDVGITVYVCGAGVTVEQIKDNIREIAEVVGETERGEQLIAQMDATLAEVAEKVKLIPADERLTVVRFSPMGTGAGTTFNEICSHAGVKNGSAIVGLVKGQVLSKEQIIMINPDFFLLPTYASSKMRDLSQYKKELEEDSAFKEIKAIKNKRIHSVPDKYLYATSQYIVFAIKELAKTAYPHLFEKSPKNLD